MPNGVSSMFHLARVPISTRYANIHSWDAKQGPNGLSSMVHLASILI
jgi:hypothetical protein